MNDLSIFHNQINKVVDGLYISGAMPITPDKLHRMGITLVINSAREIPSLKCSHVEVLKINMDDTPTFRISSYFDSCCARIKEMKNFGGCTLVHCAAGISRSACICIAYLMRHHHLNLRQAYQHLKIQRPIIHPNHGFFRQLINYERQLFGKNTVNMIMCPVGFIPDVYKDDFNMQPLALSIFCRTLPLIKYK